MPCETQRLPNQTFDERKTEVRGAIERLSTLLASGQARVLISKADGSGAIRGWPEGETARVTDGCALRMIRATGSALAKAAIAKAEALAGRSIDLRQLTHSHDGGVTFHKSH